MSSPHEPSSPADGLRHRSIRGAGLTAVAQGCKVFILFGSQVALARLLAPADFGLVAMVAPVLGFLTIFADLGLMQAVIQRPDITRDQLNVIFWIGAVFSAGLAAIAASLAPLLAWMYGEPRVVGVTICLASLIFATGLSILQSTLLAREMRFMPLAITEVAALAAGMLVGVGAAFSGLGYWSLVLSQAGNSLTSLILLWCFSGWRPSRPAMRGDVVSLLRFGAHVSTVNIGGYLSTTLDNVLVGAFLGEVPLGIYDRAWKLAIQPLSLMMAPVGRVAIPALSRLAGTRDRFRDAFTQMLQLTLAATLPALIAAIVLAKPLIVFLFTDKWADSAPVFAWFCTGMLLNPLLSHASWLFVTQGRTRELMIWGTLCHALNVASFVFGLHWGLVGVASASVLSVFFLQTPIVIWAATREGMVDLGTLMGTIVPFGVAAALDFGLLTAIARLYAISGIAELGGAFLLSYGFTAMVLACQPGGMSALRSIINARTAFTRSA